MKHSRIGETQRLVLEAVDALEPEAYGIPIQEAVERVTLRNLNVGALYATLHRLEERGLLAARDGFPEVSPDGRRSRHKRYYRLTPEGRTALEEATADVSASAPQRLGWIRKLSTTVRGST